MILLVYYLKYTTLNDAAISRAFVYERSCLSHNMRENKKIG